jgi:hypothetical protein
MHVKIGMGTGIKTMMIIFRGLSNKALAKPESGERQILKLKHGGDPHKRRHNKQA